MRLTKIICTLGPATNTRDTVLKLAKTGMNIARINLSHGTFDQHETVIRIIQDINATEGTTIAIMLDTKGSEIRTGDVETPIPVAADEEVLFSPKATEAVIDGRKVIHVNYDGFAKDVRQTDRILLDNGFQQFDIIDIRKDGTVIGRAKEEGVIGSRRHVNLPGADIDLPSMTAKDWEDLGTGCDLGVDFVALSFIRSAKDVDEARAFVAKRKSDMRIISKVETKQAVENLTAIIDASDGVMVARGDLGAEIPFELIPAIQDDIVKRCRQQGKIAIVATHMLESMIEHPMPTRAEVTDVAHAAVTRTDTTMLSGETAMGKHPFTCLEAMHRILVETEAHLPPLQFREDERSDDTRTARAVAAVDMAISLGAPSIMVLTQTGKSAQAISKFRPPVPILAFSGSASTQRKLQMHYGIVPFVIDLDDGDPEATVELAIRIAQERGYVKTGDRIVLVTDSKVKDGLVCSVQVRSIA